MSEPISYLMGPTFRGAQLVLHLYSPEAATGNLHAPTPDREYEAAVEQAEEDPEVYRILRAFSRERYTFPPTPIITGGIWPWEHIAGASCPELVKTKCPDMKLYSFIACKLLLQEVGRMYQNS